MKPRVKFITAALISLPLLLSLTSCALLENTCSTLRSDVAQKESWGGILFGEYQLQRNRFLDGDDTNSRLSQSAADLLGNYIEVHELILEAPQCLNDPSLEQVLRGGIMTIQAKVARVREGNLNAYLEMQGELNDGYQSLSLWIAD
jgi:hypothetical protein